MRVRTTPVAALFVGFAAAAVVALSGLPRTGRHVSAQSTAWLEPLGELSDITGPSLPTRHAGLSSPERDSES